MPNVFVVAFKIAENQYRPNIGFISEDTVLQPTDLSCLNNELKNQEAGVRRKNPAFRTPRGITAGLRTLPN